MFSKLIESLFFIAFLAVSFFTKAQGKINNHIEKQAISSHQLITESNSIVNNVPFRNIGPSIMSGRVTDVDANPADPTEFYVAYASGGVWYTNNNGQSFTPVFDSVGTLIIGDIAVNWKSRIIWVGTGEVNSSRSSYAGNGIYKSRDNGKTWQYLGLPESHHIGKIQLHPADDNTVWVAAIGHLYSPNKERGVFKTTDGGETWHQTLFINANTGVVDIDINPTNPLEIYAAAWYRTRTAWNFEGSGESSGIYKSTDGGDTWKLLTKEGSGFLTGKVTGRIGLAVYPKNPSTVYAVVDNQAPLPDTAKKDSSKYVLNDFKGLTKEQFALLNNNKLDSFLKYNGLKKYKAEQVKEMVSTGQIMPAAIYDYIYVNDGFQGTPVGCEIYRSDNGGESWKKVNTKELSLYSTYGYYFGKIAVSPYNDQKLVITGYDIEESTDGGKTFKKINKENVHADHHIAWIDPARDSHLIIGNDGGCNITYDNGDHWFKANSPAVAQFYSVYTDNAHPYNVYGGLQDNGVWYGPSNNTENSAWQDYGNYAFKPIMGGDGMQVQVDTRDNLTAYTGFQFGNYSRLNRLSPGETAKRITPQHSLGEKPYRFNWQTPILISRFNQDVIYFGGNKLFRSFNKGDSMVVLGKDLTNGSMPGNVPYGTITTIAESPLRFGLLYAGTDDGNLQISKDGGYSWSLINGKDNKAINKQFKQGLWVSRVIASNYNEATVYVTLSGYRNDDFNSYVFVSDDYGASWKRIGLNLPAQPVNVIREDPKNNQIIYVGTDGGLYVSFDKGESFMYWNEGMPKGVSVHDITLQEKENEIVIGTHGRSIYIARLEDIQGLQKDKDWLKKKPKEKS